MTDTTPLPEQAVRDFIAWEDGDASKKEAVAASADIYNPGLPGGEIHDREAYAEYIHANRAGFPDARFEIEELLVDGDVVMAEVNVSGTHEGEWKGIPPTGREVEFRAMGKWLITDGKVQKAHVYWDRRDLASQLGLTFPVVVRQLPKLALGKLRALL